jgi:CRISPR-associated endonuclease/helicase Cas3
LTAPLDGQGVYQPQFVGAAVQTLRAHDGQMLDESRVGPWLDDIYAEQGSSWSQEIAEAKEEFEKSCLETLRAFQSDSSLSDRFDEMFDGTEVLPRGFLEEWRGLVSDDPLQASELLVPISSRQLWRLRRQGRVLKEGREEPFVVDAPYGTESGLELG